MHPPRPCASPKLASTSTPHSIDEVVEEVLLRGDGEWLLVPDGPSPVLANLFLESLASIRRTWNNTHDTRRGKGAQWNPTDKLSYQRRASDIPRSG